MIDDEIITQLANQLGIAATKIFGIYAAGISGVAMNNLIALLICTIVVCIIVAATYALTRDIETTVFIGACAAFVLCMGGMIAVDMLNRITYPEYHALREIIRFM